MKISNVASSELTGGQAVTSGLVSAQEKRPATESTKAAETSRPTDPKELQKAVEKLQKSTNMTGDGAIEFATDQDTGRSVVKVIDKSTHDVLMQIPSKLALAMAEDANKSSGLLVNQKA